MSDVISDIEHAAYGGDGPWERKSAFDIVVDKWGLDEFKNGLEKVKRKAQRQGNVDLERAVDGALEMYFPTPTKSANFGTEKFSRAQIIEALRMTGANPELAAARLLRG